ncbi:hypothetical protein ACFFRR_001677 [Megaselia abdita]
MNNSSNKMEVRIRTLICSLLTYFILLFYVISINVESIEAVLTSKSSDTTDGKSSWPSNNRQVASNFMSEKPYFEEGVSKNVTSIADDVAILKCRVKNKKNRTVSWMRKKDLHILTTNIYTYTGDQRFSVIHLPGSDDFDLRIEYTQPKDSGIYECQVNTEPKMNLAVHLQITDIEDDLDPSQNSAIEIIPKDDSWTVSGGSLDTQQSNSILDDYEESIIENLDNYNNEVDQTFDTLNYYEDTETYIELLDRADGRHRDKYVIPTKYDYKAPQAQIMGNTEIHVKKGSTISLACSVNIHAKSITWYHGDRIVDFDSSRGGISLETEKTESGTTSRLLLTRATVKDSGNYSCIPTSSIPASASVHVLNDEYPAHLTTNAAECITGNFVFMFILPIVELLFRPRLIHYVFSCIS